MRIHLNVMHISMCMHHSYNVAQTHDSCAGNWDCKCMYKLVHHRRHIYCVRKGSGWFYKYKYMFYLCLLCTGHLQVYAYDGNVTFKFIIMYKS